MNLKKIGKLFTSKSVGTGPSSYKKRIYWAAVSQGLRNTALPFLQPRHQIGVGDQHHALAALPWERPGTYCIGGWVGPRAGLDGYGKISSRTGIRSHDRPARNESPYQLSYPRPLQLTNNALYFTQLFKMPKFELMVLLTSSQNCSCKKWQKNLFWFHCLQILLKSIQFQLIPIIKFTGLWKMMQSGNNLPHYRGT